jgi:prepilin-type N-terminal cleavage/methylation domain-containing protein
MNTLKNQKGFTLIELVLIIVILGILGAVATVQFGTIISDSNKAALDGAAGPYNAQLALAVNTLKAVPTCAQFDTEVFAKTSISGGKVTPTEQACAAGARTVKLTITAATCEDIWTYSDATVVASPGTFIRTSSDRTTC